MPKVLEQLVRHQYKDQVWFDTTPVLNSDTGSLPTHLEGGVSASPCQKDQFEPRETEG
jgi:hypothetical protein